MNHFASTVSESIKQIGLSFLVAYYLPSSVFVLIHLYLLIPIWSGASASFLATTPVSLPFITDVDLAMLIWSLLLPLAIGIILAGLNDALIRLFEGKVWWLKWGLLLPLTIWKRRQCQQRYGDLIKLQKKYQEANTLLSDIQSDKEKEQIEQYIDELTVDIKAQHKVIETKYGYQTLPHHLERITPTTFGNIYAISEEYAYDRYGIDSVLFWPRLRELMNETAPHHSARISQQKTSLDLCLNLAFISILLLLETSLTIRFGPSGHDNLLLILLLITAVTAVSFYNTAVSAVQTLGELIKISFDYHRELVLKAFNLLKPDELIKEQEVWIRLATFIRRGNDFYFSDAQTVTNNNKQVEAIKATEENEGLAFAFTSFLKALGYLLLTLLKRLHKG